MSLFDTTANAKWHYLIALVLGCALVAFFLSIITPITYVSGIDPDASYYVEAARNLLAGKGVVMTGDVSDLPKIYVPVSFWPPGFPAMVGFFSKLAGVDPLWMAPRIDWVCWALVPVALLFALRPILNSWYVHIISLLVLISPGTTMIAWLPMTDMPFMLLSIASFGFLFRATGAVVRPIPLLVSGILCGLAYLFRNVALAAFAAVIGAYAALVLLRLMSVKVAFQKSLWWGAGAAMMVIPLLIRNLNVFGSLQPYTMAPSTLGYIANIRYFVAAVLGDVVAIRAIHHAVTWNNTAMAGLVVAVLLATWLMRTRAMRIWRGLDPSAKEIIALLSAYFVAGAAVLIAARSRYQWGEFIDLRHVLQYDWILLAGVALFLERGGRISRAAWSAVLVAVVVLAGLRFQFADQEMATHRREAATISRSQEPEALAGLPSGSIRLATNMLIAHDARLLRAVHDLPPDVVLASNYHNVLRLESGRIVHALKLDGNCDQPREAEDEAQNDTVNHKMVLLLFVEPSLLQNGCWQRLKQSAQPVMPGIARPYLLGFNLQSGQHTGRPHQ
ncbi:MAG: hypothetical protein ABI963_07220 [Rhizomicrobium sp.]